MKENIVQKLTSKDDKYACAFTDRIVAESHDTDEWYEYFEDVASLLDHPKSLVRNRALYILAANAQWDEENRFDLILPDYLKHITDEKPITARQCVKALAQVGLARPQYIPQILSALRSADLSKYKDSMRPLIERDVKETEKILINSGLWGQELNYAGGEKVKYEIIALPIIAIIGKEGLCTKEKNVVNDLWHQANSNFSDIADLGMKNADGSFVGFWGAMSDETLSFMPWTDGFSRGLYLAGVEADEDTAVPDGWVKWIMPARKYLVTEVQLENYGEIFEYVINSLIPDLGMKLAGAACDFTEPATGQNKLFFPVE